MVDNGANTKTSKRGLAIALAALVVVLVAGFFAYNALSGADGQSAAASSAQSANGGSASSESVAAGSDSSWAAPSGTGPMLADYDEYVYTREGEPRKLTEIADGKPLVMNFWATWCPHCVNEMPDYLEIYNDYKDRVSFAFIDCVDGTRETAEMGAAWLADNGFEELPAYYDNALNAQYAFRVTGLPTTVIVSADGEVMTVSPGKIDPSRLRSALDSLL